MGSLADLLTRERLVSLDAAAVGEFCRRRPPEKFLLHPELGPSAYEGDIDAARVVLLLANPGYDAGSTIDDHAFARPGWPLGGLHPEAPLGLRKWWQDRLRALIQEFGDQQVSKTVACLQITPWASAKFHEGLRLPSRVTLLEVAAECAARGSVMLVMRAEKLWLQAAGVRDSSRRFRVNSWLCSYVSPGNLSEQGWNAVHAAIRDA